MSLIVYSVRDLKPANILFTKLDVATDDEAEAAERALEAGIDGFGEVGGSTDEALAAGTQLKIIDFGVSGCRRAVDVFTI